jgi:ABC-type branched-subunit amino acid transport system substrate-binding protein
LIPAGALRVVMCACTLGFAAACAPGAPPSILVVAATLPLSTGGEDAAAWQRGYQRAADDVNGHGGLTLQSAGTRVRVDLAIRDDGGDVAEAERGAEELLASGALVLLATPDPVRMVAQAAVARRHRRPYVVPAAAGPDLTATSDPWILVAPGSGEDVEEQAYRAARAALDALERARSLDGEAVRRAFGN